ncbi:MAG: TolC family protein [Opitutaceae bacterium]
MLHRPLVSVRLLTLALAALLAVAARAVTPALTLEGAIRLALENNQRIKVSEFGPQIAHANVLAAYGRFDPAITFNRSYGESETPGLILPPSLRPVTKTADYSLTLDGMMPWGLTYSIGATAENQRGTFNSFTDSYATFGGVTATQPLLRGFGFGANLSDLRIAKANRGISDWQARQTVIDTVTNVILVYNNLQEARDRVRIARLSRDNAAQLLSENEKRHRVGSISDADVTQARSRVANREESIIVAERAVYDVENQLRELLGESRFPLNGPPVPTVELAPAPDVKVDVAADLKTAYDLRPDYQAARLGIKINRASNARAQNQLLPQVDLVGSYGYGGLDPNFPTARSEVRNEDARAYSLGLVVRVPLTFAAGRGVARAAKLTLRQSEADLTRVEQDIAVSVTEAAGQIGTTQQRVAATRLAYDLQQQVLNDEQKKFKAGTSSTYFVLQEQEILALAQSSYAHALADQRRAIANYDRAIGRTLIRYDITLSKD